jgi:DNA (cytosine-5)-methyltransferase 1
MDLNVLELFGGCGGLGYGFHKMGFNIVCANELEESIAETYKHNYPETNVIVGDITKDDIKKQIYDNFTNISCDVIIGGPPCVAYSMSGHRNSRDPRGQLFKDYVAIVKKLQPTMFIIENVKGILTMLHDKPVLTENEKELANKYYKLEAKKLKLEMEKKRITVEKGKHKKGEPNEYSCKKEEETKLKIQEVKKSMEKMDKDIIKFRTNVTDIIKSTFESLGYNVEMRLLNSANYGVPQKRERVIFIGVKKDTNITIEYPEETHNKEGSDGKEKWLTVRDAIEDLKDKEEDKSIQHIITKHSDKFIEKIKKTPIGKSVNPKYTEAFFRCDPDKPSNTVKENHGGVFIHYEKNRVMTPRELARLQSFPDDFIFKGSKSCMLVQLGNAVPCGLTYAIAKQVKKMLT